MQPHSETERRIITQADPRTAPPDGQYVGRVEPDPQARTWPGRHPQGVITRMNSDLRPMPEKEYEIIEGGWHEGGKQ